MTETREQNLSEQTEPRKQLGASDAWRAVEDLTSPTRRRLKRDDGAQEWVELPSLFAQLVEAMESGSGGKARGVQESKPPLDASALELLIRIAGTVRSGCWNWGVKRSHDTPKDLRSVVSAVVRHNNPDEIDQVALTVRQWCGQIRATISSDPDRTWRMHGAACTVCGTSSVPIYGPDGDITRQPAMIVHSDDGVIRKVECGFCGTTLTGPDLTTLVNDTLHVLAKQTSDGSGRISA